MKRIFPLAIFVTALLVGGIYYIAQNKRSEAIKDFIERERPITNDSFGLNQNLAKAVKNAEEKLSQSSTPIKDLGQLASVYHANGYLNEAWQSYRILIALDTKSALWPYRLATILSSFGKLEDAAHLYESSISLDPNYSTARIRLGQTYFKLNHFDKAQNAFEKLLEKSPQNAFAHLGLGRCFNATGQKDQAIDSLKKALTLSKNLLGGDLLADIYESEGETTKARRLLNSLSGSSQTAISDPWIQILMDDCFDPYEITIAADRATELGNLDDAVRLLKKAASLAPVDQNIQRHLAILYKKQRNYPLAEEHYTRAKNIQPDYADAWAGLIEIAALSGNDSHKRQLINQALVYCRDSPAINNFKGDDLIAQKRASEAISHYKRVIRRLPHEAIGYTNLARAYLILGNEEQGIAQMERALLAEPANPIALTTLTFISIGSGKQAQAETYLQRAFASYRVSEKEIADLAREYIAKFKQKPLLISP